MIQLDTPEAHVVLEALDYVAENAVRDTVMVPGEDVTVDEIEVVRYTADRAAALSEQIRFQLRQNTDKSNTTTGA